MFWFWYYVGIGIIWYIIGGVVFVMIVDKFVSKQKSTASDIIIEFWLWPIFLLVSIPYVIGLGVVKIIQLTRRS